MVGRTCLLLYQRAREERKGAGGFVNPPISKEKTAESKYFLKKAGFPQLRRGSGDALIRDVAGTLG